MYLISVLMACCAGNIVSGGPSASFEVVISDENPNTMIQQKEVPQGNPGASPVLQLPDNSQMRDLDSDDPAHPLMIQLVASIKKRYAESALFDIVIDYAKEVKGPAIRKLLPAYRFLVCQWSERAKKPRTVEGLRVTGATFVETLALDRNLKSTSIGPLRHHSQTFGEFLAKNKIKVVDEASARLVWDAFCEVRRWWSKSDRLERVSDRLWRVGILDNRDKGHGRAYYEIRLNEDLTVESAKWTIEDARDGDQDEQQ